MAEEKKSEILTAKLTITLACGEVYTFDQKYKLSHDVVDGKTYPDVELCPCAATPANEQCGRDVADLIEQMEQDAMEKKDGTFKGVS